MRYWKSGLKNKRNEEHNKNECSLYEKEWFRWAMKIAEIRNGFSSWCLNIKGCWSAIIKSASFQVWRYRMAYWWNNWERIERRHLQREHCHRDGDGRPVDISLRCLRREGWLYEGRSPSRQKKSRRRDRPVQANHQHPALGMNRNIIVIFLLNIVKMRINDYV